MKTITVTIEITNLDEWDIDWNNEKRVGIELLKLNKDIKESLITHVGIDTLTVSSKYEANK